MLHNFPLFLPRAFYSFSTPTSHPFLSHLPPFPLPPPTLSSPASPLLPLFFLGSHPLSPNLDPTRLTKKIRTRRIAPFYWLSGNRPRSLTIESFKTAKIINFTKIATMIIFLPRNSRYLFSEHYVSFSCASLRLLIIELWLAQCWTMNLGCSWPTPFRVADIWRRK